MIGTIETCARNGCDNTFTPTTNAHRYCRDKACNKARQNAKDRTYREAQDRRAMAKLATRAERQSAFLRELTLRLDENALAHPRGLLPIRVKSIHYAEQAGNRDGYVGALLDLAAACVAAAVES